MNKRFKIIMSMVVSVLLLVLISSCSRSADSKQTPATKKPNIKKEYVQESDHNHSETEHDDQEMEHGQEEHDHSVHEKDTHDTSHDDQDHPVEEHKEHVDEGGHEDHDHSAHSEKDDEVIKKDEDEEIMMSPEEISALGIMTKEVQTGSVSLGIQLQGEIRLNADKTARIVSRLSGIVSEVRKTLGDPVAAGEVLAVIESRDLAEARAIFHSAVNRLELAKAIHERELGLWKQKISSEQEYLDAKKAMAEASIELQLTKDKLIAFGISKGHLESLPHDTEGSLLRYELVAPFDGTIVKKGITLGEVLGSDSVVFVVSDLNTVWADLSVYQKDLPQVKAGQKAIISSGAGEADLEGVISYVGPILEDDTRRALARVVLPNNDGSVRPGIFVTAKILEKTDGNQFIVAKSALQNIEGENLVFLATAEGFRPQHVVVGQTDDTYVEVLEGLRSGEKYVDEGAFELKSIIITGGMDSHAGHGH